MMGTKLPAIRTSISCSHCGRETNYDEGFTCEACGIHWTGDPFDEDAEANFIDDEAEPCARPSQEPPRITSHYRFHEEPCSLPTGHTSEHYFYIAAERITA